MGISTRTRFEILKRDGFRCRYCGATAVDVLLHVDHVVARANGGTDDPENLVTSCADCNLGKSDISLDESRIRRGPTTEDALEHAAQIREYLDAQRAVEEARAEFFDYLADYWRQAVGDDPLERWYQQLRSVTRSHPIDRIIVAIDAVGGSGITGHTRQVKYFYGVLRRRAESGQ